jgi:type IV pilus assembly protein PilW
VPDRNEDHAPRRQRGIALIEVLVAIVLLGIGVLGTIGLQGRRYSALADTGMRAEATIAAEKLHGRDGNDQANLPPTHWPPAARPAPRLQALVRRDHAAHIPGAGNRGRRGRQPSQRTHGGRPSPSSGLRKSGSPKNTHSVVFYLAPAQHMKHVQTPIAARRLFPRRTDGQRGDRHAGAAVRAAPVHRLRAEPPVGAWAAPTRCRTGCWRCSRSAATPSQAGYGLNDPDHHRLQYRLQRHGQGYTLAPATRGGVAITPMAPVVIESNGSGPGPRHLLFRQRHRRHRHAARATNYTSGTRYLVDRYPYGFARATSSWWRRTRPAATARWPSCPTAPDDLPRHHSSQVRGRQRLPLQQRRLGAASPAARRGCSTWGRDALSFRTWSVADGYLQLRRPTSAVRGAPATVADNIVSIKAQYGFDTRVGAAFQPQKGMQVGAVVVDHDQRRRRRRGRRRRRLAAHRRGAPGRGRAQQGPERRGAGSACSATTAQAGGLRGQGAAGVAAAPVTVDVAVAGDPVDWHCYRYRVFETVVPCATPAGGRRINPHPNKLPPRRERGIALPVMLMILALMLVGSIYLLKSVHSTTLTTGNLAYDATLSREADLGLHTGFDWLRRLAIGQQGGAEQRRADQGLCGHLNVTKPRDENGFWNGSKTITDGDGTQIEYVIHRMCAMAGAYDDPTNNRCVQTARQHGAPRQYRAARVQSSASTAAQYAGTPRCTT